MRKIKFWMDCGYVGTDDYEIVEFSDETTDEEIESYFEMWFWNLSNDNYGWEEIEEEEEEECDD